MTRVDKIKSLVRDGSWDKIYTLMKKENINPSTNVINDNNIVHIATLNNKIDIIKLILKSKPSYLKKINKDGNTPIHIMGLYGYDNMLKLCLKHDNSFINILNNDHENILHLLAKRDDNMFEWVIKNIDNVDLNQVSNYNHSILTICIKKTKKENDKFNNRFNNLLELNINLSIPKKNPPLNLAIKKKKEYLIKPLIKNDINVNSIDSSYMTPLLLAVYNSMDNVVKLLIDNNVDISYTGPEGEHNPVTLSLIRGDENIFNILLENGFDINKYNGNIETVLHIGFQNEIKPEFICKLIYHGDMNIQNLNGTTPLHIFLNNFNWKNYNKLLENKKLDIFVKDKNNKSPINFVKNNDLVDFITLISKIYIKNLDNNLVYDETELKTKEKCYPQAKKEECLNFIKQYIFETKKSYPDSKDELIINKKFTLIEEEYTKQGSFNADTLHNMIYTVEILKRNKNLCVPFQYFDHDKMINDRIIQNYTHKMVSKEGSIMSDLIKIYTDYFYELLPYLVLWRSSKQYYYHKNLGLYLKKLLNSNKCRFILLKLTIITSGNSTHANIIIFDKTRGILERFEPYGKLPYLESDELDEMIEKEIGKYFSDYLKKKKKKLEYFSRTKSMNDVSFQTISKDEELPVRKYGDPVGYCLAWTFWYLEMRIKNPDIHPRKLIKKSVELINKKGKSIYSFIDFIRNYASKLDSLKNNLLLDSGIEKYYLYNMVLNQNNQNKLLKNMTAKFNKIMDSRV